MNRRCLPPQLHGGRAARASVVSAVALLALWCRTSPAQPRASTNAVILDFKQRVNASIDTKHLELTNGLKLPFGSTLRTSNQAWAIVKLTDAAVMKVNEQAEVEFFDPTEPDDPPIIHLLRGALFGGGKTGGLRVVVGAVTAITGGTDFLIETTDGRTLVQVFGGEVLVRNGDGETNVIAGEEAVVMQTGPPQLRPTIMKDLVEWWLHYPMVLDIEELDFTTTERQQLEDALSAWQRGNIRAAMQAWPLGWQPRSAAERVFAAALDLAAGQLEQAQAALDGVHIPAADGLRAVIAAVRKRDWERSTAMTSSPSAQLGLSYWEQSLRDPKRVDKALAAAQKAVRLSKERYRTNGIAWERVAELEFSRGDLRAAREALGWALSSVPEFAPAHALKGFLLAAANRNAEAITNFDKALRLDRSLADAWLGQGLCLIRMGEIQQGCQALRNAAGIEPFRSLLRSYLGKAWETEGDRRQAREELDFAAARDPGDPTPWFYRALLDEEEYRYNSAITNMERSLALNDNRSIYRSELLLDEDRAVRSANLARIYDRAGLSEVALREASRAVTSEYANWSAHLFLAESYDALRDPARVSLRYETPWLNELLLARLMAPAAAGAFSQNISQQEYTRLFEHDRVGLNSATEVRSDGRYRQQITQYGIERGTSWAVDLDWERREGTGFNDHLSRLEVYPQFKQQVSDQDCLLLFAKLYDYRAGDLRQLETQTDATRDLNVQVSQLPIALAGWHREWSPGVHTLLLGGRLEDEQRFSTGTFPNLVVDRTHAVPRSLITDDLGLDYLGRFEIWSGELNQIVEANHHTLIAGLRCQDGTFDTSDTLLTNAFTSNGRFFGHPAAQTRQIADFSRLAAYGYDNWELLPGFLLIGGLTYDRLVFPRNFLATPISGGSTSRDLIGPKAGLVFSPTGWLTLRGMYAQSLGGASFDESFRLEPSQVAGFNQAYRSLLPESAGGGGAGQRFEFWGAAADLKPWPSTYLGIEAAKRNSREDNIIGDFNIGSGPWAPSTLAEDRGYEEKSVSASLHRLLGECWSGGTGWRFTRSELSMRRHGLPASLGPEAAEGDNADLHEIWLRWLFNHPSGFFARGEATWFLQNSLATAVPGHDESLFQVNLFAGWRFPRQRGEFSVGVLNLTDVNYQLDPLNPVSEIPRERIFVARFKVNF
jgi:tetratricopeptide (TPR) repeat protein